MKVRPDELRAIRSIEEMAKYVGKLEGYILEQRERTQTFINMSREMNSRHLSVAKAQSRYITRLQVRLQNRLSDQATSAAG